MNGHGRQKDENPYAIKVPVKFVTLTVVLTATSALTAGLVARNFLFNSFQQVQLQCSPPWDVSSIQRVDRPKNLPVPVIPKGKEIPNAVYTSKNFNIAASIRSSNPLIQKTVTEETKGTSDDFSSVNCGGDTGENKCRGRAIQNVDEDDEEHLPAGQHLLVDIKHVDGDFLNDEERLAQAMIDVVNESQLTLLSYHCHALEPTGVSCAGVLLESHIAFHTWPEEGVITLDLFTCGSNPLIPVLPSIIRLFGVPSEPHQDGEPMEAPTYLWAHKLRGFRDKSNAYSADLGKFCLSIMDFDIKQEVASVETEFQHIHIYDVINPRFRDLASYNRSLSNDGSYEANNAELFLPDRIVFLDGIIQSSRLGEEPYHESLVHPGMFAHPDPRHVAIIGGGEGATLREVLKHNTVEQATMIEIDRIMVEASRQHTPSWSDCSDIIGSASSCFEDPRADVQIRDGLQYFIDRSPEEVKYDVIIMDALDPQDNVEFAGVLYDNEAFLSALYKSMSDDGVIIMQLGESPFAGDPADDMNKNINRANMIHLLEKVGMKSFHPYEDFHGNFLAPWSYVVACKSLKCRSQWFSNEAEVNVAMHKRIVRTHSGKSALKYFDGATMSIYQLPHRVFENIHCRSLPSPLDCEVVHKFRHVPSIPADATGISGIVVPDRSLKRYQQMMSSLRFPPDTVQTIRKIQNSFKEPLQSHEPIYSLIGYYGVPSDHFAKEGFYIDSSMLLKGRTNSTKIEENTEAITTPNEGLLTNSRYNPAYLRHTSLFEIPIA